MYSEEILDAAAELARKANQEESDYVGEDGLTRCGVCHERKQSRITLTLGGKPRERVVYVPCRCRRAYEEDVAREREKREDMARLKALRGASMLDVRLKDARFENAAETPDNAANYRALRRYAEKFSEMEEKKQGLLLMGDPGTGKTFAAACLVNRLLDEGVSCVMTSFVRLVSMMGVGDDIEGLLSRLTRVRLLVLDDLGAQRDTDYAMERVNDVIDRRYQAGKPMVITTNLKCKQLTDITCMRTWRVYDRVLECCAPLTFTGPSWRRAEASRRAKELTEVLHGAQR